MEYVEGIPLSDLKYKNLDRNYLFIFKYIIYFFLHRIIKIENHRKDT